MALDKTPTSAEIAKELIDWTPAEIAIVIEELPKLGRLMYLTFSDMVLQGLLAIKPVKEGEPFVTRGPAPSSAVRKHEEVLLGIIENGGPGYQIELRTLLKAAYSFVRNSSGRFRRKFVLTEQQQPYFKKGFLTSLFGLERLSPFGATRSKVIQEQVEDLAKAALMTRVNPANIDEILLARLESVGGNIFLLDNIDSNTFELLAKRRQSTSESIFADSDTDVGSTPISTNVSGYEVFADDALMNGGEFGGAGAGGSWGDASMFDDIAEESGVDSSWGDDTDSDGGDSGCSGCGGCGGCD